MKSIILLAVMAVSAYAGVSPIRDANPAGIGITPSSVTVSNLAVGGVVFSSTPDNGRLSVDATNLFWDDTNNRLGVGTNSPGSSIHVSSGNIRSVGSTNEVSAIHSDTLVKMYADDSSGGNERSRVEYITNGASMWDVGPNMNQTQYLGLGALQWRTGNATVKMILSTGGVVGINTASPASTASLHVVGSVSISSSPISLQISSSSYLGTNPASGIQLFYCNGGTFTGNICRGAACICTGGSAAALGIYVP